MVEALGALAVVYRGDVNYFNQAILKRRTAPHRQQRKAAEIIPRTDRVYLGLSPYLVNPTNKFRRSCDEKTCLCFLGKTQTVSVSSARANRALLLMSVKNILIFATEHSHFSMAPTGLGYWVIWCRVRGVGVSVCKKIGK